MVLFREVDDRFTSDSTNERADFGQGWHRSKDLSCHRPVLPSQESRPDVIGLAFKHYTGRPLGSISEKYYQCPCQFHSQGKHEYCFVAPSGYQV